MRNKQKIKNTAQESQPLKDKLNAFLKRHKVLVISTVGEDKKSESSMVEFFLGEGFEIFFGTSPNFRKYKNITKNRSVSVVFGDKELITVQYEGTAKQVPSDYLPIAMKKALASQIKDNSTFFYEKDYVYFSITPDWIRYTDVSTHPWEYFEISF